VPLTAIPPRTKPSGARQALARSPDSEAEGSVGSEALAQARADDHRNVVNSLAKGLRILEAFTPERLEMTLSEVAQAARLDPGTTFRMLNTLVILGYVARVAESKRFRLTLKAADLGLNAIGHADLRELARPILRSLVGAVNEAASIGVLDGADILYIDRVRAGVARIGVDIRVGTTIPAFCSAIGQAVMAFLPPSELERVLAKTPRSSTLAPVPIGREKVMKDLEEVRRLGFALRDSYFGSGLRILAAPVFDTDGYPIAGLSVVAPAVSADREELRRRAEAPLRTAAAEIARAFQASGAIAASI
jgi:IclR family pca regulon transcriptional regulator